MTSSRFLDASFDFANERAGCPVEELQYVDVTSWLVIRASSGKLHLVTLVSTAVGDRTVGLSSPISSVDSGGRIVTTSSGRRYELMGPPEVRELERDLLHSGAVRLGMGNAVDVSVFAWDLLHFDSVDLRLR